MRVCVLVTTRGRHDALERLFASLLRQTHQDFSIVFGDQSGGEAMDAFLSRYTGRLVIERRILPLMSLSAARNALLPFIKGDYVYFSDDDSYPDPSAFAAIAQYARQHPEAGALVATGSPIPLTAGTDLSPARELSPYSVFSNCPSWCVFIKKDVIRNIGAFDERMGIGAPTPWQSGEETDYLLRVLAAGNRVVRCPAAYIYHDPEDLEHLDFAKIKGYGAGRMYTIRKHSLPFWFALCNILYPLAWMVLEAPRYGMPAIKKRMTMFYARLQWYCRLTFQKERNE